jgi:plasmid stabilization system protein ParE
VADRPVRLHPLAADEAEEARGWYFVRSAAVADAFRVELDAAIASIAESPRRWPRVYGRFRRYLLHKFPFSVVGRNSSRSLQWHITGGSRDIGQSDETAAL